MQPSKEQTSIGSRIRVAVCGESVAWAAIEAVLRKEPGIDVMRCWEPEDWHRLLEMDIDVILFDATATASAEALSLLKRRPGLTMIRLDFDDRKIVAHLAREDTVTTVEDLARVIRSRV
jgi:hypothetical protein